MCISTSFNILGVIILLDLQSVEINRVVNATDTISNAEFYISGHGAYPLAERVGAGGGAFPRKPGPFYESTQSNTGEVSETYIDNRPGPSLGFYVSFSGSGNGAGKEETGISYSSTRHGGAFQEHKIPLSSFIVDGAWDYKMLEESISNICSKDHYMLKVYWFTDRDLPEIDIKQMPKVEQLMKDL